MPYRHNYGTTENKALIGGSIIFVTLIGFLFLSVILFLSSGPIILGTEMNTNGLVEYLCLGSGCDDLHDMNW